MVGGGGGGGVGMEPMNYFGLSGIFVDIIFTALVCVGGSLLKSIGLGQDFSNFEQHETNNLKEYKAEPMWEDDNNETPTPHKPDTPTPSLPVYVAQ